MDGEGGRRRGHRVVALELSDRAGRQGRVGSSLHLEDLGALRTRRLERRDAAHDARHWAVFPTPAAQKIHADLNAASGEVTQRIQRQIGKENFTDTVSKVRGVCSALK